MNLKPLALALFAFSTTGVASAQQIMPNGTYVPAPQTGTVIQPATYTSPMAVEGTTYTMPQTTTYTQPGMMTGGMTSGTTQYFPSSMPGSTVLNGTTRVVTNAGTTVVSGTRRAIRRGLGIFRR